MADSLKTSSIKLNFSVYINIQKHFFIASCLFFVLLFEEITSANVCEKTDYQYLESIILKKHYLCKLYFEFDIRKIPLSYIQH